MGIPSTLRSDILAGAAYVSGTSGAAAWRVGLIEGGIKLGTGAYSITASDSAELSALLHTVSCTIVSEYAGDLSYVAKIVSPTAILVQTMANGVACDLDFTIDVLRVRQSVNGEELPAPAPAPPPPIDPEDVELLENTVWSNATIYVDPVKGDDDTGAREGPPFATLAAALAVAESGDVVHLSPGSFPFPHGTALPEGVQIIGQSQEATTLTCEAVGVTPAALVLATANTSIENCKIEITMLDGTAFVHLGLYLYGVGQDGASQRLRNVTLQYTNMFSAAPTAFYIDAAGGSPADWQIQNVTVVSTTQTGGNQTAMSCGGSGNRSRIDNLKIVSTARGFRTFAGAQVEMKNSMIQGVPDLLVHDGSGALTYHSSNRLVNCTVDTGSESAISAIGRSPIVSVAEGAIAGGSTSYLVPGGAGAYADEFPIIPSSPSIIVGGIARVRVAPGSGNSLTFTLMRNGVATGFEWTLEDDDLQSAAYFPLSGSILPMIALTASDTYSIRVVASATCNAEDVSVSLIPIS